MQALIHDTHPKACYLCSAAQSDTCCSNLYVIWHPPVRPLPKAASLGAMAFVLHEWHASCACCHIAAHVVQDEFELDDSDRTVIAAGAPRHWRLRHQHCGTGAFHGLHVSSCVSDFVECVLGPSACSGKQYGACMCACGQHVSVSGDVMFDSIKRPIEASKCGLTPHPLV